MRQIIGKRLLDVDVGQIAERARAFPRTLIDVGTGDGRYPLFVARARTDTFVIGIDPATDALAHAARRVAREHLPNLVLLVGAVEAIDHDFDGLADEVRVHFPWGSLLHGVIGEDDVVLDAFARLPRPGGSVTALLSIMPRDGVAAEPIDARRMAARWAARGLIVTKMRTLTKADVEESASSWGKRLGAGGTRPGLYVRAVKERLQRTSLGSAGRIDACRSFVTQHYPPIRRSCNARRWLPQLPPARVIEMATSTPASVLGPAVAGRKGRIAPGCDADAILLDKGWNVTRTYGRGVAIS